MKKFSDRLTGSLTVFLFSPFILAWTSGFFGLFLRGGSPDFRDSLFNSFRQLSVTLLCTGAVVSSVAMALGYFSILWPMAGKTVAGILGAFESIPGILIALFCYAPVSGYMARHSQAASSVVSLLLFILAATLATLPEAVRGITLPLGDLYYRKYSLSFRSYGFPRSRILSVLMGSRTMREAWKRNSAGILLKTLVLDCSFGFIIQLGFGSFGTPTHASPGALIAANRDSLYPGGEPLLFYLPVVFLSMTSMAFLVLFGNVKDTES